MKNYLNFEGLSYFLNKLLNTFTTKEDIATEEEILALMQEVGMNPILVDNEENAVYTSDDETISVIEGGGN